MLKRPEIIDDLQDILSAWVAGLEAPRLLGAFLFGSTVNENGVRFQPDKGDLDVVVVVDWEKMAPGDRVVEINSLRNAKAQLEAKLFQKLHRINGLEQIVSLVPLTPFEVEQAIHKDRAGHILTSAPAYDLTERRNLDNLGGGTTAQPVSDLHHGTLAFVQKKRAEALAIRPNGTGGLAAEAHDDPVPKQLMRHFAIATFDGTKGGDPADLARGLREIRRFAEQAADWTPMTTAFASWLEVLQGARGDVPPIISDDHYLLVLEAIYDRVRQQYLGAATVRFSPPPTVTPPSAAPSLPASHRLAARLIVTGADKLGGSKDEVLRAIRAARANMKARVSKPLELAFEESDEAANLIDTADEDLTAAEHQRKVKAFERRTLVAARQIRWTQGTELILWYGGTLFGGDEAKVEEACRIAISNWFAVAATNIVNPGGMFEAAHRELYRSHGLALSFPAKTSVKKAQAGLQPLSVVKPLDLAAGFVPNLISKYLYLSEKAGRADLQKHADDVFDFRNWEFGLK